MLPNLDIVIEGRQLLVTAKKENGSLSLQKGYAWTGDGQLFFDNTHGKGAWFISCEYQRTLYGTNIKRIYQAEAGTFDGTVDSDYRGFTGSGFVNTPNNLDASITWTVHSARSATKRLTFRYANGSTNDRPADIVVNGVTVGTGISFPAGEWNRWDSQMMQAPLNEGDNSVVMIATTAEGCPNVDMLAVDSIPEPTSLSHPTRNHRNTMHPFQKRVITSSGRIAVPDWAVGTSSISIFTLSGKLLYSGAIHNKAVDLTGVLSNVPGCLIVQYKMGSTKQ